MHCCRDLFCRLGVLPLLFSLCSIITIIITYSVSVADGDVYPWLPAISDTGGIPPESNIFGFCLSACSFIGLMSVVVRYYQYRFISENNEEHRSTIVCVNKLALVVGIVSTSGALVVAAFQVILCVKRMYEASVSWGFLAVFGITGFSLCSKAHDNFTRLLIKSICDICRKLLRLIQPAKLRKKQCGGVYFLLYSFAF